jgi:hypothetical protein
MTELADCLRELAEGAAGEVRPPGADLARRQGRRRRRRLVAGVALAIVFAVALVGQGRLADWAAPALPARSGGEKTPPSTPFAFPLAGAVEVGRGQLPQGGSWRLEAGTYDDPDPAGKPAVGASLTVAIPGRPTMIVSSSFEEPVRLGVATDLTASEHRELPVRPVFGAASPSAARVVVIPRRGGTVLAPIQAELLALRPGIPARFWVAVLPAGGRPRQSVHQVRSYDAGGRELCRLDPDTLTPRCSG